MTKSSWCLEFSFGTQRPSPVFVLSHHVTCRCVHRRSPYSSQAGIGTIWLLVSCEQWHWVSESRKESVQTFHAVQTRVIVRLTCLCVKRSMDDVDSTSTSLVCEVLARLPRRYSRWATSATEPSRRCRSVGLCRCRGVCSSGRPDLKQRTNW